MLYPMKFRPRLLEKIWGGRKLQTVLGKPLPPQKNIGESWELYDFPPGVCEGTEGWVSAEIDNGPLAGRSLHSVVEEYGRAVHGDVPLGSRGEFPILIKFLDARENLSVQVHPDAEYAARHPGAHVKSEAWYVVESEPGARLYRGVVKGTSREQFRAALADGTVERLIQPVAARPGDCYYLPSGTVHALGAGILVAEVQTPSDTTFRVFDFNRVDESGRARTLHVEQALECIRFDGDEDRPQNRSHVAGMFTAVTRLVRCPFFVLEKVRFTEGVEEAVPYDQPVVWIMLEGEAEVRVDGMDEAVSFRRGDTVLLPARMKSPVIRTKHDCVWLEATFPGRAPEAG